MKLLTPIDKIIDRAIADRAIADRATDHEKQRDLIVATVSEIFEIPRRQILTKRRYSAPAADARFAAYLISDERLHISLSALGRLYCDRDHTTILHGIKRARTLAEVDPSYNFKLQAARQVAARLLATA